MAQTGDGPGDRPVGRVVKDVAHETLVDLQLADRELVQVVEDGIAGAEMLGHHLLQLGRKTRAVRLNDRQIDRDGDAAFAPALLPP